MRVTLTVQEDDVRATLPDSPHERGGDCALVAGACPRCRVEPFAVQGGGMHIESHDTYAADAACAACKARVGTLRARMSTLFGLEEDERVLGSCVKVY